MKIINLKQTVFGCPTIFEWENAKGESMYFRLRHGWARIINETLDKTVLEAEFGFGDGICNWDDVVIWAKDNGVNINMF